MRDMSVADIRALPEAGESRETASETVRRKFPFDLFDLWKNRLLMGSARYGGRRSVLMEQVINEPQYETEIRMISKLIQFLQTRNLEFLLDVMVYAGLIWRFGNARHLHFRAVERHEVEDIKRSADAMARVVRRMAEDDPHGHTVAYINAIDPVEARKSLGG